MKNLQCICTMMLLCFVVGILNTSADTVFVRYNYLGYTPSREKKIILMADHDVAGQRWALTDKNSKTVLEGQIGASLCGKGNHAPMPCNYSLDVSTVCREGVYYLQTDKAQKATINIKKNIYAGIIEKPVRWFYAELSGSDRCVDRASSHYGDSACTIFRRNNGSNADWISTGDNKKVNVAGGWYDAGDYLKMTLTIGYSAYFLSKAYQIYPAVFTKKYGAGEFVDIVELIKWGCDYLCRCMPDTNEFIIMVGGKEDHDQGCRLPDKDALEGKRPALSALSQPQMGYAAAALAAGSMIFTSLGKKEIALKYRSMAELIYRRALSKDAVAPAWQAVPKDGFNFYDDDTPNDNLELAATELYRLTKKDQYLIEAKSFADKARNAGTIDWACVNLPAHLELMEYYPLVKNDIYLDLNDFLKFSRKPGNIWGLPFSYTWAVLYSFIAVGAATLDYQVKTGNARYASLGISMLDYLMGINNWGVFFIATKEIPQSIKHPYSQIYLLQSKLFPVGAIAEGPGDTREFKENSKFMPFDETVEPTHPFNTNKAIFNDNDKDFMSTETCTYGIADGIYLLSAASKMFQE